jgi:CRISPR/Cas system CSM-associated protein Csm5 (group 7 of RAMP superfamily)
MNFRKPLLFMLVVSLLSSSCFFFKSNKTKPAEDTAAVKDQAAEKAAKAKPAKAVDAKNFTEIVFGWGGGFTGMVDEYHLLKNGNLKKGTEEIKTIDAKQMKIILAAFKKVNFSKLKLNDPGNLYYFMAAKAGDNEQRLIWNDHTELPAEVKAAYEELMKTTR